MPIELIPRKPAARLLAYLRQFKSDRGAISFALRVESGQRPRAWPCWPEWAALGSPIEAVSGLLLTILTRP